MKIGHKVNHGWEPPAEITSEYQAEIDKTLVHASARWRAAQHAIASAERRASRLRRQLEQRNIRKLRIALAEAENVVESRWLELHEIERLMQQQPTSGVSHSERGSVRNPLPKASLL